MQDFGSVNWRTEEGFLGGPIKSTYKSMRTIYRQQMVLSEAQAIMTKARLGTFDTYNNIWFAFYAFMKNGYSPKDIKRSLRAPRLTQVGQARPGGHRPDNEPGREARPEVVSEDAANLSSKKQSPPLSAHFISTSPKVTTSPSSYDHRIALSSVAFPTRWPGSGF